MEEMQRYDNQTGGGKVLIIDNDNYRKQGNQGKGIQRSYSFGEEQQTSKQAMDELTNIFKDLGFSGVSLNRKNRSTSDDMMLEKVKGKQNDVKFKNLTKKELLWLIKEVAQDTDALKNEYCFVCVILTFGEPGLITCVAEDDDVKFRENGTPTNDMQVPLSDLQEPLKGHKCAGLLGKPKIFLVQADPWPENLADNGQIPAAAVAVKPVKIPREADFLTHFSSTRSYDNVLKAWKDAIDKHVRQRIKEKKPPLEIQTVLTRVNGIIREEYGKEVIEIPCVTTLLTKEMYFNVR